MIRIPVLILAALICCSLAGGVSAQGFFPGMASLSGWSCAPAHKANCSVDGKLGYLGYNRGLVFDIGTITTNVFGTAEIQHQYAIQGIWVGASAKGEGPERGFDACDPGDGLCFVLGASWLFPNNKDETAQYNVGTSLRNWSTTTQWYTLEASASRCAGGNFSLIGGFRYDSFATKFADPYNPVNFGQLPTDEAELSFNSYIPYVGAETAWGPVKVGVIGFPWILGTVHYRETYGGAVSIGGTGNYRNAYFLETFLEAGKQLRAVNISAFAMYTVLHATGEFDVSAITNIGGNPLGPQPFNFSIDRQNWIVGGKAVIGLNSPL